VVPPNPLINEALLYLLLALGACGVAFALPRRGLTPALLGGIVAAAAIGGVALAFAIAAREHIPNLFFYIFATVGLGAALRMITHPRPVYSALYFVLTILASAGLFVLLAAEFLAFALIIIYAGAILITYLFVIMLATQAPIAEEIEFRAEYDQESREPIAGAAVGFILLAIMTTMMFRGVDHLPAPGVPVDQALLPYFPGKVERALRNADLITVNERVAADATGRAAVDTEAGFVTVVDRRDGSTRDIPSEQWPPEMWVYNVEGVGWDLLAAHPGSIEIAGIILLMAMLGAAVLARRQVQLDDDAKARHADHLMEVHGRIGAGRPGE
jgi:NADH-quinone oxidoreductase subunit J